MVTFRRLHQRHPVGLDCYYSVLEWYLPLCVQRFANRLFYALYRISQKTLSLAFIKLLIHVTFRSRLLPFFLKQLEYRFLFHLTADCFIANPTEDAVYAGMESNISGVCSLSSKLENGIEQVLLGTSH